MFKKKTHENNNNNNKKWVYSDQQQECKHSQVNQRFKHKEETSPGRIFCHNMLWMLLPFQHNRIGEKREQHCQLDQITSGTRQVNIHLVTQFWKLQDKNKLHDPLVTSTRTYRNKLFASSWVEYTFKFRLLKEIIKYSHISFLWSILIFSIATI